MNNIYYARTTYPIPHERLVVKADNDLPAVLMNFHGNQFPDEGVLYRVLWYCGSDGVWQEYEEGFVLAFPPSHLVEFYEIYQQESLSNSLPPGFFP